MQRGFSARAIGLSFVATAKFKKFAFVDEDLVRAGYRKILPSKAQYYQSHLCRACQLYIVDYSILYSRKEAEQLIKSYQV